MKLMIMRFLDMFHFLARKRRRRRRYICGGVDKAGAFTRFMLLLLLTLLLLLDIGSSGEKMFQYTKYGFLFLLLCTKIRKITF